MSQYVLRLTDATDQPLTDAGTVVLSELFTGAILSSSPVDARGFTQPLSLLQGVLYAVATDSATLPFAIVQPSIIDIISVTPASAKRGAAIVGTGVPAPPPAANYVRFVQATPAAVWTIPHSLGYDPVVTTIGDDNEMMIGDVDYPSLTLVVITFSQPVAGTATLV